MNTTTLKTQLEDFLEANPNPYVYGCSFLADSGKKNVNAFEGFHSDSWTVGGLTGGNCWGDEADKSITAEEEADFTQLDKFLETYYPNISFLQYKKLLPLIKTHDYTVGEYYGNYTDYRVRYIEFVDLIEAMSDLDLE